MELKGVFNIMNSEIYLVRGGSAASDCESETFNKQMKALSEHNICALYKTAVDNSEESLNQALKMTLSDEEEIELVIVADAIEEGTKENAEKFFSNLGVKKNDIREISAEVTISEPEKKDDEVDISGNLNPEKQETEKKSVNVYTARVGGKKGVKMLILPKSESTGLEFADLLYGAVYAACIKNQRTKGSWWKNFIPIKGDKPLEIIRKSILMIAIATFLVSGALLFNELIIKPAIADNTNSGIKELLTEGGGGSGDDDDYNAVTPKRKKIVIGESEVLPDFESLLNENPDTVGWIKIPNTRIDYVVCQSQDPEQPEFYLKHDFYGNYSDYGTIFLDYRSPLDANNLIIHGHHMNDGRMFADLMNYQYLDFYKENPAFTFNTIYEKAKWKIISIYKTNTLESQGEFFNYLRGTFETESDFMNYIYQIRARSIIDCPVDVNEDDTLITLSTCCYDFDQFRFVVVARRVREGETAKVDTSNATMASNPVYPDCWYETYGGKKPVLTSFEEALEAKEIDWYDNPNKKKWSVSEAQKEATQKAEKERKEEEKIEEASKKAENLSDANELLESANSYLDVAKENIKLANEVYDEINAQAATAKKDYETAYNNAKTNLSKAKTEKEVNAIIKALNSARSENVQIIDADMDKWQEAIERQCDEAIDYAEKALKKSSDVKSKVTSIKETANDYKSQIKAIIQKLNKLSSNAEKRVSNIDSQLDKANTAIQKIRAAASEAELSKAESSKAESSKTESSKVESSKTESSEPESSEEVTETDEQSANEAA